MRNFLFLSVVAGTAAAASIKIPRLANSTCSFYLTATGGETGSIGSLVDGQLRIGGATTGNDYGNNNLETTAMGFTMAKGGIWDQDGSGCILAQEVDGSAQFQCDAGKAPTYGFSIAINGSLEYNNNAVFWACAASDVEYNLYTIPVPNQPKCYEIGLTLTNSSNGCSPPSLSTSSTSQIISTTSTYVPVVTTSPVVSESESTTAAPVVSTSDVVVMYSTAYVSPSPATTPIFGPSGSGSTSKTPTSTPIPGPAGSGSTSAKTPTFTPVSSASESTSDVLVVYSTFYVMPSPVTTSPISSTSTLSVPGSSTTEKTVYVTVYNCAASSSASVFGSTTVPSPVLTTSSIAPISTPTGSVSTLPNTATELTITSFTTRTTFATTVISSTVTSCPASVTGCIPGGVAVITLTTASTTVCPVTTTQIQTVATGFSTIIQSASTSAGTPGTSTVPGSSTTSVSGTSTVVPGSSTTSVSGTSTVVSGSSTTSVSGTSTTVASSTTTGTSSVSSGTCLPNITLENNYFGSTTQNYQYPHLIIPVSNLSDTTSNTAYGTQYFGDVSANTSTIFNFDIPSDYSGKTCSLVMLLPEHELLETSAYTTTGAGLIDFAQLTEAASSATTYNNQPSVKSDLGIFPITTGSSTRVLTFACPAGETLTYKMTAVGDEYLYWFNDWNPSPLGLFITYC